MGEPVRIFRVLMVSLGVLFLVKAVELATAASGTFAEEAKAEEKAVPEKDVPAAASAPSGTADAAAAAAAHSDEKSPSVPAEPGEATPTSSADVSRSEVEVLQKLAARRAELDQRARDLDLREKLLTASEQRVGERISELKALEINVQKLLGQRDAQEEAQIASLVKVYESMKPKDAARIFEELDMEVLLPVADRMKEAKIGAVLAAMNSDAAKRLTVNMMRRPGEPPAPEAAADGSKAEGTAPAAAGAPASAPAPAGLKAASSSG